MTSEVDLRRSIETCELDHAQYQDHFQFFDDCISDALDGFTPRVEWMVGPSRAGKSMLLNALARKRPQSRIDGQRHVPVLLVPVSPLVSPKQFPESVFKALKLPVPSKSNSAGELLDRACDQLKRMRTKVMLLEEASHFVDVSAHVAPRGAADMLKTAHETVDLTILAFGIPRLRRLFDSNDQLRLRAGTSRRFLPYDFSNADHRLQFVACVRTFVELFEKAGWPIVVEFTTFVKHCYLISGGLIGVLSKFMQKLASRKRDELPRALTFEDCQIAASMVASAGHPLHEPFASEPVSLVDLNQAYGHVMQAFDLPPLRKR